MDIVRSAWQAPDGTLYVGIEVNRIEDLDVGSPGQGGQGPTGAFEAVAEVFPPMTPNRDKSASGIEKVEWSLYSMPERGIGPQPLYHVQQGVDDGVSGDGNAGVLYPFAQQIKACAFGGRKVQFGQTGGEVAVHLFGPGGVDIAGAQSGFHMAHRNALLGRDTDAAGDCLLCRQYANHRRHFLSPRDGCRSP